MAKKSVKFSIPMLERMILKEASKFKPMKDTDKEAKERTKEIGDDSEKLSSLEKDIDHVKALKIKEAKLTRALREVRRQLEENKKRKVK